MFSSSEDLAVTLMVNTTLEELDLSVHICIVSRDLTEKLMTNCSGVLQQLQTITIKRTVRAYGGEEACCALMAVMEEWRRPQVQGRTGQTV